MMDLLTPNSGAMMQLTYLSRLSLVLLAVFFASTTLLASDIGSTRTPWQMHEGEGVKYLEGITLEGMGTLDNYQWAEIPGIDDAGWKPAPNPDTIGFGGAGQSKIDASEGWRHFCQKAVDYTYFQTFVRIPENVSVPDVRVAFKGMDDGSRISIYNDAFPATEYPSGKIDESAYVKLNQEHSEDLSELLRPGNNRIVITQVDVCARNNQLEYANITIDHDEVPTAKVPEMPKQVRMLVYSVNDAERKDGTVSENDYYMALRDSVGVIEQNVSNAATFDVVQIDSANHVVALRVASGPGEGRFLHVEDNSAGLSDDQNDKAVQFRVRPPLEPALGDFVSLELMSTPGEYLRHQGYVLKRDKADMMSASLLRRDATFRFENLEK